MKSCSLLLCWCLVISCHALAVSGKGEKSYLSRGEAVTRGGLLYRDRCRRCHLDYEQERLAAPYDAENGLIRAIGETGCRIAWSRKSGGDLSIRELQALAAFLMRWEETGREPVIDEPAPPEPDASAAVAPPPVERPVVTEDKDQPGQLSEPYRQLLRTSLVARGGWLYTANCYRCHLAYEQSRMGKGAAPETVHRFISEGKTSTQMKPFGSLFGGPLKNSDISAVVAYIEAWEQAGERLAIAERLMTPPAVDPADFVPLTLPDIREVAGDGAAGGGVFGAHCSRCHGVEAEGYIGPSLIGSRGVQRGDLFLKSVVKRGVPGSLMTSWDRNGGGPLFPKDIDDVVVFLLSLEGQAASDRR